MEKRFQTLGRDARPHRYGRLCFAFEFDPHCLRLGVTVIQGRDLVDYNAGRTDFQVRIQLLPSSPVELTAKSLFNVNSRTVNNYKQRTKIHHANINPVFQEDMTFDLREVWPSRQDFRLYVALIVSGYAIQPEAVACMSFDIDEIAKRASGQPRWFWLLPKTRGLYAYDPVRKTDLDVSGGMPDVEVYGRELDAPNSQINGVYVWQADKHGGRPVYRHQGTGSFLYFHEPKSAWVVGDCIGHSAPYCFCEAKDAETPAHADGVWHVFSRGREFMPLQHQGGRQQQSPPRGGGSVGMFVADTEVHCRELKRQKPGRQYGVSNATTATISATGPSAGYFASHSQQPSVQLRLTQDSAGVRPVSVVRVNPLADADLSMSPPSHSAYGQQPSEDHDHTAVVARPSFGGPVTIDDLRRVSTSTEVDNPLALLQMSGQGPQAADPPSAYDTNDLFTGRDGVLDTSFNEQDDGDDGASSASENDAHIDGDDDDDHERHLGARPSTTRSTESLHASGRHEGRDADSDQASLSENENDQTTGGDDDDDDRRLQPGTVRRMTSSFEGLLTGGAMLQQIPGPHPNDTVRDRPHRFSLIKELRRTSSDNEEGEAASPAKPSINISDHQDDNGGSSTVGDKLDNIVEEDSRSRSGSNAQQREQPKATTAAASGTATKTTSTEASSASTTTSTRHNSKTAASVAAEPGQLMQGQQSSATATQPSSSSGSGSHTVFASTRPAASALRSSVHKPGGTHADGEDASSYFSDPSSDAVHQSDGTNGGGAEEYEQDTPVWLHQAITADEAESLLRGGSGLQNGKFLVRFDPNKDTHVLEVVYKGRVTHHVVSHDDKQGGALLLNGRDWGAAHSLVELVDNLRGGKAIQLGWPQPLGEFVPNTTATEDAIWAEVDKAKGLQEELLSAHRERSQSFIKQQGGVSRPTSSISATSTASTSSSVPVPSAAQQQDQKEEAARQEDNGSHDPPSEDSDPYPHLPVWVHVTASRPECETLLIDDGVHDGTFLVRAKHKPDQFVLFLVYKKSVTQHLIKKNAEGVFIVNGAVWGNNPVALVEVIDALRGSSAKTLAWPQPLLHFIPRPGASRAAVEAENERAAALP